MAPVSVQACLCQTWSENPTRLKLESTDFPVTFLHDNLLLNHNMAAFLFSNIIYKHFEDIGFFVFDETQLLLDIIECSELICDWLLFHCTCTFSENDIRMLSEMIFTIS